MELKLPPWPVQAGTLEQLADRLKWKVDAVSIAIARISATSVNMTSTAL